MTQMSGTTAVPGWDYMSAGVDDEALSFDHIVFATGSGAHGFSGRVVCVYAVVGAAGVRLGPELHMGDASLRPWCVRASSVSSGDECVCV